MSETSRSVVKQRGVRILIVEDEPSVRESLELLFTEEGHVIASATSGKEAMRLIGSGAFRPEIVIVDYSIPGGMSGLDVIDGVRAALGQHIRAVVLTGDISSAAFAKIATRSAIHLTKPVRADELSDAIQRLQSAPQPAPPTSPQIFEPMAADNAASAETIVIVDDDDNVRQSVQQLLESYGHKVLAYPGGRAFIESKDACSGSCVILDARMPGLDGFEVLANITADGRRAPTIMITGHGDVQTAVRAMKAGAFDFIEKPVDADQLRASVDRALRTLTHPQESAAQSSNARNVARLSKRQRAVMDLVVAGHANKVIANRLGIGQRTVESHRAAVMKKLGAKTFADLIRLALAAPQERGAI